ncbi:Mobile element protein [Acetobacter malorum]|nr:Mobile element protein [Acetobacter malorum]
MFRNGDIAFIDRALPLPKDWTSKPERLKRAHVPDDVVFATKSALASKMIEQCLDAGVPFR